jgi:thymidylate kinase
MEKTVQKKSFLLLEGTDGVGKTSAAKALGQRPPFPKMLWSPPEPLREIRAAFDSRKVSPEVRLLFYLTGNAYHSEEIRRILKENDVVLDRFLLGTVANHNVLAGKDFSYLLGKSGEFKTASPDITIVLVASERERKNRILKRNGNGFRDYDLELGAKVQDELVRCLNLPIYQSGVKEVLDTSRVPFEAVVAKIADISNKFRG